MRLTCSETLQFILDNQPALPPDKRLDTALRKSGLDGPVTLLAIAYRESRFDPDAAAGAPKTALGLFQFVEETANDTQDRIVKKFLAAGTAIPNVPAGKRFVDHRDDAAAASFCAWLCLLDHIAHEGNQLEAGISHYGTEGNYGKTILQAVVVVRKVAKLSADQPTELTVLKKTLKGKCPEVVAAMNEVFGY